MRLLLSVLTVIILIASCQNDSFIQPDHNEPLLEWVSPSNGDSVVTPFYIQFQSKQISNAAIEVMRNDSLITIHTAAIDSILIDSAPEGISNWNLIQQNTGISSSTTVLTIIKNQFRLDVSNGSGSGFYPKDEIIDIKARSMIGLEFESWSGDILFLNDRLRSETTVIMPQRNIQVEPDYSIQDTVYFFRDVQPIIETSCALPDCHDTGERIANLTSLEEIQFYAPSIKDYVASGFMPTNGELTEEEKNTIIAWVNQGFMIN